MNPTHTFSNPNLTLQCSTDEKALVASFPSGRERAIVTSEVNPLTGGIALSAGGDEIGAGLGATVVTYDAQERVATHDNWTVTYDSAGRVASQTNGTQTQTFNYDTAGRFTGVTEV